jgi:hypothetical protein
MDPTPAVGLRRCALPGGNGRLHGQQLIWVNADEVPALEHLDLEVESVREGSRTKQQIIKNLGRKDAVLASGELERLAASVARFAERAMVLAQVANGNPDCETDQVVPALPDDVGPDRPAEDWRERREAGGPREGHRARL